MIAWKVNVDDGNDPQLVGENISTCFLVAALQS
jgi:hypothetical protein